MVCKYCNAEIEDTLTVCPVCGKNLQDDAVEETADEVIVEMAEACDEELVEETAQKKEVNWKLITKISAAVLSIATLAVLLLLAMGVELLPRPNTIGKKDNYTVSDKKAEKKADVVVATMGGKELTNAELMLRYRTYAMYYVQQNSSNLSSMGLDYKKDLSEQMCTLEGNEEITWQQYLLQETLKSWEEETVSLLKAEQEGYVLSEESEAGLAKFPATLEEQAIAEGYASVDAMLQELFGVGCTQDLYMQYVRASVYAEEYYYHCVKQLTPSDADAEVYFDANAAEFEESGITKDAGLYSSVRHILIIPEGGVQNESTGLMDYTDDEWEACLVEAEGVLNTWKAGEATEKSFAALVPDYSEDTGSLETGGLYEGIYFAASYVEEFRDWAIDPNRKPGDTDIVKTYYGYHIMYFVSGEPAWLLAARNELHTNRVAEISQNTNSEWVMEVNYGKIVLSELKL